MRRETHTPGLALWRPPLGHGHVVVALSSGLLLALYAPAGLANPDPSQSPSPRALDTKPSTFRLSLSPEGPIFLGEVKKVHISIEAPENDRTKERPLRVAVNVGGLGPVTRVAPGRYETHYRPPRSRFPQVALLAIWRETGPDAKIEFVKIPLSGRTKVPVRSRKGAQINVFVGDQTFGPVTANARGRAQTQIFVPPGVKEVEVRSSLNKRTWVGTVPVRVPPYNRLTLAVTPHLVRHDGVSHAIAHVYYDPPKDPIPISQIRLSARGAKVEALSQEGTHYRFRIVPLLSTKKSSIRLQVRVRRDATSRARTRLSLGVPRPERIALQEIEEATENVQGTMVSTIRVLVMDHVGLGVPGQTLLVRTSTRAKAKSIDELGQGRYQITLELSGAARQGDSGLIQIGIDTKATEKHVVPLEFPLSKLLPPAPKPPPPRKLVTRERKRAKWVAGARVGLAQGTHLMPLVGVEFGYRWHLAGRPFYVLASASFRQTSRDVALEGLPGAKTTLQLLPLTLGAMMDLFTGRSWRAYAGAGFTLLNYTHELEAPFQAATRVRGTSAGAELFGGVSYKGVFLEVTSSYAQISETDFRTSNLFILAALGYRLTL